MKPNSYPSNFQQKATRPPSVPISLYRQVVEELQVTQSQLSAVKANNQQLQQEVEQLMKSAHKTQQLVRRSHQQLNHNTRVTPVTKVKPIWQAKSWDSLSPKQVVTVKSSPRRNSRPSKNATAMNGWVLAIAIMVIILTAFTSGFLLVRPLLNNDN